jgi:phosphate transport system substrate-binding protein
MIRWIHKVKNVFFVVLFFLLNGCQPDKGTEQQDTIDSGTIYISVDESFKPVIDSEIQVFEALHPNAKIIPTYKPKQSALKISGWIVSGW